MTLIQILKLALWARRRQCVPLRATTAAAAGRRGGDGGDDGDDGDGDGGDGDLPCRAAMRARAGPCEATRDRAGPCGGMRVASTEIRRFAAALSAQEVAI